MIKTSSKLVTVSVIFLIVGVVFLLSTIFAPLSYDGVLLSPPNIQYYVSKSILLLLSIIYFILFGIVLLYYFNRKIYLADNGIIFINYLGYKKVLDPKSCEIKILRARFDLYHKNNNKKICSISFMSDGDVFDFIKRIEKVGVTRKY